MPSVLRKTFILKKIAIVKDGNASVSFINIPACSVLAQLHILNGNLNGKNNFHGVSDLLANKETVIELAPKDSGLAADLVAKIFMEIGKSEALIEKTTLGSAASIKSAIEKDANFDASKIDEFVNSYYLSKGRITGKVLDDYGEPVVGAAVKISQTDIFTVTSPTRQHWVWMKNLSGKKM